MGKVDDVNSQAQKERSGSVELGARYLGSYTSIGGRSLWARGIWDPKAVKSQWQVCVRHGLLDVEVRNNRTAFGEKMTCGQCCDAHLLRFEFQGMTCGA